MRRMAFDWTEDREWILEHHPRRGSSTLKKDRFGILADWENALIPPFQSAP